MVPDRGLLSALVLFDLDAAFDLFHYIILLRRLENVISIKDSVLNWFRTYLSGRIQFVHVNNKSPEREKVSCGVPQGSLLRPIFICYLSEILLENIK